MANEIICSKSISAGTRVYYIDALRDSRGEPYMSISEIATDKSPKECRTRIFIHRERMAEFASAFAEVAEFIRNQP